MLVENIKQARLVIKHLFSKPDVSCDTETVAAPGFDKKKDALVFGRARIKIFSMCHRGEAYSFPTNFFNPQYPTMAQYSELLKEGFASSTVIKVFHNFNYDGNVFFTSTTATKIVNFWDTMIGGWLANVDLEKGLKSRAPLYGRSLGSLFISKDMQKKGFTAVDMNTLEQVAVYAEEDVIVTDEMFQMQTIGYVNRRKSIPHISKSGALVNIPNRFPAGKILVDHEGPLTTFQRNWYRFHESPYLAATMRAERRGFPFSIKKNSENRDKCATAKDDCLKTLYQAAGQKINLNSSPQLVKHIFEPHGIETPFLTKKGKVSLNAAALFKMRASHPLVATLEKYRKLETLQKNYLGVPGNPSKNGLEHYVAADGRIHCTMNTIGAVTGRNSAQNPNLTQIPSRADIFGIKASFEAPKGKLLICIDYAQLEIRIMAILCKDPLMQKILRDPKGDIHQNTADRFSVDRSPTAKQLNFLMLYGGGAYMLAEKLTLEGVPTTKTEAGAYIATYDDVYYRVRQYRKELLEHHKEHGFVNLLTGRQRYLGNIDWDDQYSVHKAETTLSNNVVQGSGQDMLKSSIIRCDPYCINVDSALPKHITMPFSHRIILREYAAKVEKLRAFFKKTQTQWILQVHDEVIYFVDKYAYAEVIHALADVMTWRHFFPATTDYNLPLVAEGGVGQTWLEAKSKKPMYHVTAGFK